MNPTEILSTLAAFIGGQLIGILGGLYVDNRSWKARTSSEVASFAYNFCFLLFALLIVLALFVVFRANLIRGLGLIVLVYLFLLWPAWIQTRQFKISLRSAYFGTMHQFHATLTVSFCFAVACTFTIVFTGLFGNYSWMFFRFLIGVSLIHNLLVFGLMAFARPFWTKELLKLRKIALRHSQSQGD